MYTLKSIARRGSLLGATTALVVATVAPSIAVFADELNPLTERSLLLSSSAPGFQDTDGSGYSVANPNPGEGFNGTPDTYAPAGTGPNGKKTGETFTFKTSSTGAIAGFSLQYCTTAAGKCVGPGNNTGDADPNKDGDISDSTRIANETPTTGGWANKKSDLDVTGIAGYTETAASTPASMTGGQFGVYIGGTLSTGWVATAVNKEDPSSTSAKTGKKNYITLTNNGGSLPSTAGGTQIQVIFKASETSFITNPGAGAFFVKINTWDSDDTGDFVPGNAHNIDGGVTVANVMTDSIHITTKVLETMAFSVGTQNPDTQPVSHGTCDAITQVNNNRLSLGNSDAEYSLETGKAWDVYSYWRLSSNSSGGASVYYSGNTLANTMGDEIADMPSEVVSHPGTEQFGLGFVDAGLDSMDSGYTGTVRSYPFITLTSQTGAPYNTLAAQPASTGYDEATGTIDDGSGGVGTAKFKFKKSSSTVPELIAQESESVISCATAKMRYVGNIAADTPAGVYTTKINYLAAPQY